MEKKLPFYGWETDGYWSDIGSFDTYKEAQFDILHGRADFEVGRELEGNVFVRGGSKVATSAELCGCVVIGENVVVGEKCVLEDCIILDDVVIGDDVNIFNSVIGKGCKINDRVLINHDCVLADRNVLEAQAELLTGVKVWPGRCVLERSCLAEDLVG